MLLLSEILRFLTFPIDSGFRQIKKLIKCNNFYIIFRIKSIANFAVTNAFYTCDNNAVYKCDNNTVYGSIQTVPSRRFPSLEPLTSLLYCSRQVPPTPIWPSASPGLRALSSALPGRTALPGRRRLRRNR